MSPKPAFLSTVLVTLLLLTVGSMLVQTRLAPLAFNPTERLAAATAAPRMVHAACVSAPSSRASTSPGPTFGARTHLAAAPHGAGSGTRFPETPPTRPHCVRSIPDPASHTSLRRPATCRAGPRLERSRVKPPGRRVLGPRAVQPGRRQWPAPHLVHLSASSRRSPASRAAHATWCPKRRLHQWH